MRDVRCNGCPGLGEPTEINVEEITEMATNKNKPCVKVAEGCKALAWKQGFCWKHHPDHVANKKAACVDKQEIRNIHKAAATPEQELIADWEVIESTTRSASTYEVGTINLLQMFRQKREADLNAEMQELSDDLAALPEPFDQMILVMDRLRA
jgi:hypothetical protein